MSNKRYHAKQVCLITRLWYRRLISLGCSLLLCSGCTSLSGIPSELDSKAVLADIVLLLNDAETSLTLPSADFTKIFRDLLQKMPRGGAEVVRKQLSNFQQRAPAPGAEFRCGPEFMAYRARQELWRIKDLLLHTNPRPAEPQFCYAMPIAIDLSQLTGTVEVYGYDLDQAPLELFLVNGDVFEDVSFALHRNTHYHLTLDLGNAGAKFSPNSKALSLAWGHFLRYSIPVVQATTPLCQSAIEEVLPGKTIVYPPLLVRGSGHFSVPGASVWSSATLDYESNKIDATVCMTAAEKGGVRTTYSGCGVEYVYTSDPDRVIEGIFGQSNANIAYVHGNPSDEVKVVAGGGLVRQWFFSGFSERSSVGREVQVAVRLNQIRFVSTMMDGCISAIAYSEAKSTNSLSSATIRRLDSELTNVAPALLQLRPRFAPPAVWEGLLPRQ
jgi:hypothetical protein